MLKYIFSFLSFFFSLHVSAQWTSLTSNTSASLQSVFFLSPDTGFVCGAGGTILKTTDGGLNWTSLTPGTGFNFNELFFLDKDTGYTVGDSAIIIKTIDGGNSWNAYFAPYNNCTINCIHFINATTGFAGGEKDYITALILKTTDGGASWNEMNVQPYFLDAKIKSIKFTGTDTGYACTRGLIYKTTDAGLNWFITDTTSVQNGSIFSIFEDMHFFSPDSGLVAGWYNPVLASTSDGGNHWNVNPNWQLTCIDFPSPVTGYISGWGSVYKTTDHGITWMDVTGTANFLQNDIDFVDGNTGYVVGENGTILKTINGATAIHDQEEMTQELVAYPNPAKEEITFAGYMQEGQKSRLKIISQDGSIAWEMITDRSSCTLNTSHWKAGIYMAEFLTDKNILRKKICLLK